MESKKTDWYGKVHAYLDAFGKWGDGAIQKLTEAKDSAAAKAADAQTALDQANAKLEAAKQDVTNEQTRLCLLYTSGMPRERFQGLQRAGEVLPHARVERHEIGPLKHAEESRTASEG